MAAALPTPPLSSPAAPAPDDRRFEYDNFHETYPSTHRWGNVEKHQAVYGIGYQRTVIRAFVQQDYGIRVKTRNEASSIRRVLDFVPTFHLVHKDFEVGVLGALRALATGIAGTYVFKCAFKRKKVEGEIFNTLQKWSADKKFEASIKHTLLASNSASLASDLSDFEDGSRLCDAAILCYLDQWWRHARLPGYYSVVMVAFNSASRTITAAQRLRDPDSHGSPVLAFRRVDDKRLQAYAPAIDLSDVSFDGQPETSARFLRLHDPRFAYGAPSSHLCHRGVFDTGCFAMKERMSLEKERSMQAIDTPDSTDSEGLKKMGKRRRAMAKFAKAKGSLVNPLVPINGEGRWDWLELLDEDYALRRGYHTQEEALTGSLFKQVLVKDAIAAGGPIALFTPRKDFLNPSVQPPGSGTWQYLSSAAEELASITHKGDSDLGLASDRAPTAKQIWEFRLAYPRFAPDIDVVWVPDRSSRAEEREEKSDIDGVRSRQHAAHFLDLDAIDPTQGPKSMSLWSFQKRRSDADLSVAALPTWFECRNDSKDRKVCNQLMPLPTMLALAMNDLIARQKSRSGRLCHMRQLKPKIPGSKVIFFADRAWGVAEWSEYLSVAPTDRLAMSKADSGWHWHGDNTKVMPIIVVDATQTNVSIVVKKLLFDQARVDNGLLVLLCWPKKLSLMTISDLEAAGAQVDVDGDYVALRLKSGYEGGGTIICEGLLCDLSLLEALVDALRQIFRDSRDGLASGVALRDWSDVKMELKKGTDGHFGV